MTSLVDTPATGARRIPKSIAEALRGATIDALEARVLLQHVLGVEHAYLIAHADRALSEEQASEYLQLLARRQAGEPIAYLIGWREFYGRRFQVSPAVLIPRPETELLIDLALERVPAAARTGIGDLGTGCGNIALTLALERPAANVVATDISAAALSIAAANVAALAVRGLRLLQGDWLMPVADSRFDLIVANPPYVALGDAHLQQGDLRFEPRSALLAGIDGMESIRRIVTQARSYLHPGGWLLFEHGFEQGDACARLLHAAGYADVFLARDLAALPRVSGGRTPVGAV